MVDILKWVGIGKYASVEEERALIDDLVREIEESQKTCETSNITRMNIHAHTNESDGLHDWRYLFDLAREKGIGVVAIADHNGLDNSLKLYEHASADPGEGVIALPGIEVATTDWNEVLLYFRKPEDLERFYKMVIEPDKKRGLTCFIPKRAYETVDHVVDNFDRKDVVIHIPHPFAQKNWQARKCLAQLIAKGDEHSSRYSGMLETADGIELVNAFHSPKCNPRTVDWVRNNRGFMQRYHFFANTDYHSVDKSWDTTYTEVCSPAPVTYDALFDAMIALPGETDVFFRPRGSRIDVPSYFRQVLLAGVIRAANFVTGRGFEKYTQRFEEQKAF